MHKSIFADHLTPVLAYRCLVKEDDRDAPSFLFECVDPEASSVVSPFISNVLAFLFVSIFREILNWMLTDYVVRILS